MTSRFLRPRVLVALVAILAVAGVGAFLYITRNSGAIQYRTAAAVVGTVTQTLPISGNLAPVSQTDLDFLAAGRVQAVSVQAGQSVNAGDVLATLDPTSLQGALTQAQANLTSAQARLSLDQAGPTAQNVAQAQATVNTAQVQLQSDQTSQTDTEAVNAQMVAQAQSTKASADSTRDSHCPAGPTCAQDQQSATTADNGYDAAKVRQQQSNDQAQAQVNRDVVGLQNARASLAALQQGATPQQIQIDQSQVQVDQVNVDTAQRALNNATLTAPNSGVVSQVSIVAGQAVSASGGGGASSSSASSSSTSHAISILTPGAYAVTGAVSDAQVGQVTVGQAARVTPAGATEALNGKVTYVAAVATVTSGVATFAVTVTIDGNNPALHAGTSASIEIIVNQASQVLTVPTSAVRGGSAVEVLVNGRAEIRPVTIGASDPLRTQIVSGLNPGDQVITATVSSTVPTTTNGGGLFGGGGGRGNFGGGGGRGGVGPGPGG